MDMATLRDIADVATVAIKVAQGMEELSAVNSRITAEVAEKTAELSKRNEELYHMNYRLERRNNSFEALTQISQELTANVQSGEQQILQIIHKQASQIMDTDNMYIALYDPRQNMVSFGLAYMDGKPVDIAPRSEGRGRTEWIIDNKTPILNYTKVEAENWYERPNTEEYIGQTFASWLGVPIMIGTEVLGVIATYHKTVEYKYDPDDLKVLTLMGRQAAIALQNARLIRQLDARIVELDKIRELGEDLSKGIL
jgi:transcriptional regulator with GAF, ATPase, and Fis domain